MRIWVDGWQMECCGEPFSVGSEVAWTLGDHDPTFLHLVLGSDGPASRVDAVEEHHGGVPADAPATAGVVTAIRAVFARYAPDAGAVAPVPDSGWIVDVTTASGRSPTDTDHRRFAGYLVTLTVPDQAD